MKTKNQTSPMIEFFIAAGIISVSAIFGFCFREIFCAGDWGFF